MRMGLGKARYSSGSAPGPSHPQLLLQQLPTPPHHVGCSSSFLFCPSHPHPTTHSPPSQPLLYISLQCQPCAPHRVGRSSSSFSYPSHPHPTTSSPPSQLLLLHHFRCRPPHRLGRSSSQRSQFAHDTMCSGVSLVGKQHCSRGCHTSQPAQHVH